MSAPPVADSEFWLRFWGVRGTIACPGGAFIRYGGNTSCIEVRCGPHLFILDAGTGLRGLGAELVKHGPIDADLLLTHTHLDHIAGMPFFPPVFKAGSAIRLWAGHLGDHAQVVRDEHDRHPVFLLELAHYEWIELALTVSNLDEQLAEPDVQGDLIEGRPFLNPVLANLAYQYPVHRIRPRVKVVATPTFLLVFRDAGFNMRFIEQSNVSARLLGLLESGTLSGREAVARLADEIGHADPPKLVDFARAFLEELRQVGAILGTLNQPQA